jgi:hypothetical protein
MIHQIIRQIVDGRTHMHRSLLTEYAEREAQMDTVYEGEVMRRTALAVGRRLGQGRLILLSTTRQGAGVAAACAAARGEATSWRQIDLMLAPEVPTGATPVFVEVVDPGQGWRDFVIGRYPEARFVFAEDTAVLRAA